MGGPIPEAEPRYATTVGAWRRGRSWSGCYNALARLSAEWLSALAAICIPTDQ